MDFRKLASDPLTTSASWGQRLTFSVGDKRTRPAYIQEKEAAPPPSISRSWWTTLVLRGINLPIPHSLRRYPEAPASASCTTPSQTAIGEHKYQGKVLLRVSD